MAETKPEIMVIIPVDVAEPPRRATFEPGQVLAVASRELGAHPDAVYSPTGPLAAPEVDEGEHATLWTTTADEPLPINTRACAVARMFRFGGDALRGPVALTGGRHEDGHFQGIHVELADAIEKVHKAYVRPDANPLDFVRQLLDSGGVAIAVPMGNHDGCKCSADDGHKHDQIHRDVAAAVDAPEGEPLPKGYHLMVALREGNTPCDRGPDCHGSDTDHTLSELAVMLQMDPATAIEALKQAAKRIADSSGLPWTDPIDYARKMARTMAGATEDPKVKVGQYL